MKWFADNFDTVVRKNKKKYPLYGFLSFLMDNGQKESLTVKVEGSMWNRSIERVTFQFNSSAPHSINLKDFTTEEYVAFFHSPQKLLAYFQKDEKLKEAQILSEQVQNTMTLFYDMREDLRTNNGMTYSEKERKAIFLNIGEISSMERVAVERGANFNNRLGRLYQAYLEAVPGEMAPLQNARNAQPDTSTSEDYIEVQLLTILKDPEVSESTKSKAKDTLDGYRQQKEEVPTPNPKEEDALISIQTIQEHYMKGVKPV